MGENGGEGEGYRCCEAELHALLGKEKPTGPPLATRFAIFSFPLLLPPLPSSVLFTRLLFCILHFIFLLLSLLFPILLFLFSSLLYSPRFLLFSLLLFFSFSSLSPVSTLGHVPQPQATPGTFRTAGTPDDGCGL